MAMSIKNILEEVGSLKFTQKEYMCDDVKEVIRDMIEFIDVHPEFKNLSSTDRNNYKKDLNTIKRNLKKDNKGYYIVVEYNCKDGYGRYYIKNIKSFQTLQYRLRNTLVRDNIADIDMVNGCPTLLTILCNQYGWKCDSIKKYTENRKDILKSLMNQFQLPKWEIKRIVLRMIFGGSLETCIKEIEKMTNDPYTESILNDHFGQLDNELNNIRENIVNHSDFQTIVKMMKRKKQDDDVIGFKKNNIAGSVLSCVMFTLERYFVEKTIDNVIEKDLRIRVNSIIHDGFHTELNDHVPIETIIKKCNDYMKQLGYGSIKFDHKPIDEDENMRNFILEQKQIQNEIKQKEDEENIIVFGNRFKRSYLESFVEDHAEASDKIVSILKDKIFRVDNDIYVFDGHIWNNEIIFNVISDLKMYLYQEPKSEKSKPISFGGMVNHIDKIIKHIQNRRDIRISAEKFTKMEQTSLKTAVFKNCWIDYREDEAIYHDDFTSELFATNYYEIDVKDYDENIANEIIEKSYTSLYGEEQGLFLRKYLGCSLFGDNTLKHVIFGIGDTNSGKSIFTNALSSVFQGFQSTFSPDPLTITNNNVEERRLAPFGNKYNKRLLISNESCNSAYSGEMIKKVVSGGQDKLLSRKLFKEQTELTPFFNLILFSNDMPKIEGADDAIQYRILILDMKKQFVDEITNAETQVLKDNEYCDKVINNQNYINQHLLVLMDAYEQYRKEGLKIPESMKFKNSEWIDDDNNILGDFMDEVIITENQDDYISNKDIKELMKSLKMKISNKKLYNLLKQNKHNIETKVKYINGKSIRVMTGIRFKTSEDEN